jgi:repressor LexA
METHLTPKQKNILEWIEQYLNHHHTMPSRREIAEGLGLSSPATIQQHIEALEKKGFLKRGETRESRALQWTSRSKKLFLANQNVSAEESQPSSNTLASLFEIPLLGTIAAGYPIEVYPDRKMMSVPLELFMSAKQAEASKNDVYMLSVRGDSMIDEGIFPNDWVILRKTKQPKSGDTVAALLNGEATLKKFVKQKNQQLELHPANPKYPIMPIREDDRFEVQGILVGVIRRYQ